ncbi:hypothetical protein WJX74_001396 [Apatococcus lobatus]|uniref:Uncharacterized protein n=2 Tax=Apatococcus TaxID=904362 RepID=A0AAW1TBW2_9CHLO
MSPAAVIAVAVSLGSVLALLVFGVLTYVLYRWRASRQPKVKHKVPMDIEIATSSIKPAMRASHDGFQLPAGMPAGAQTHLPLSGTPVLPAGQQLVQAKAANALQRSSPRTPLRHAQAPLQVALIRRQQCSILPTGKVNLSIQIQQEGMRVLAVEVRESQADTQPHLLPFWRPLRNVQADTWELLSFKLGQPFDMRITSSAGKQVLIRDVIRAFNQQQPSALEPSVIPVNFGSPRGQGSSVLRLQNPSPGSIGTVGASLPQALSLRTPSTQPSTLPAATPPGQHGEAVADPLWRTSDTLDMPGYDCDPARLDAELEDALATHQDINTGEQPHTIYSTMSRISKELEDVESNPSDIVLTAASMAPFFNTRQELSGDIR